MIWLKHITQKTDSHCGPAVIEMIMSFLGHEIDQDDVVDAAEVGDRIEEHGTRPDHLAKAVARLAPELDFKFKQNSRVEDVERLVKDLGIPVIVNWQGLFYDTLEEQEKVDRDEGINEDEGHHGHYSIVVDIDVEKDLIMIVDPYQDFASGPRKFSLKWFESRWWDLDKWTENGRALSIRTNKLIFIVIRKDQDIPEELGMLPAGELETLFQDQPIEEGETDAINSEGDEGVIFNEVEQEFDRDEGGEEGEDKTQS